MRPLPRSHLVRRGEHHGSHAHRNTLKSSPQWIKWWIKNYCERSILDLPPFAITLRLFDNATTISGIRWANSVIP
jgi:hypothetical protein